MAAGYISASAGYLVSHDSTDGLVTGFSRNVADFPINRLLRLVQCKKSQGAFLRWGSDGGARVLTANGSEFLWPRGHDEPHGADETETGEWVPFITERRRYGFSIDDDTANQADWQILYAYAAQKAMQAMTDRTNVFHNVLANTAWGPQTSTVATITGTGGDDWGKGTKNNPIIMNCLNYAAATIRQNTLGTVKPQGMNLLVNPNLAKKMAASQEMRDYFAQSPYADQMVRFNADLSAMYGLPNPLYGFNVVVDDTVIVRDRKKADASQGTRSFLMPDNVAYMLSRPDGLEGMEGSPSYSTVQMFWYRDELTVEQKADPDARRISGRVISDYRILVPSIYTGFKFTAA